MEGDNCVKGFNVEYQVGKVKGTFNVCQCFNGEYATYFAKSKMISAAHDCSFLFCKALYNTLVSRHLLHYSCFIYARKSLICLAWKSLICLGLARKYFGEDFAKLKEFSKLHSKYKATQEYNLEMLATSLRDFFAV